MEKFYTNPEAEVIVLSEDDVITASGSSGTLEDILKPPVDDGWGGFQ